MDSVTATSLAKELQGKEIGGWRVGGVLGHGKSALVLQAEEGHRKGAIKVFERELVERFGKATQLARINRELQLVGEHHENLIQIFAGGECPVTGYLYVVMERHEWPNLATANRDVPRDRIAPLISQIAKAAQFLESKNLVHRDIKPDNIVVSPDFSRAVLLDLGVLRPIGVAGLTDVDQKIFVGTLQYSSPEYLFREENDTIEGWRALTYYQLGAVLYDLISQQRIFHDFCDPFPRLVQAVKEEVPQIKALDVSQDLILLAKNCLLKDPVRRLHLIDWGAFHRDYSTSTSSLDVKERIRRMQAQSMATRKEPPDEQSEATKLALRQSTVRIHTAIQQFVREECIRGGLFPPFAMHESETRDNVEADTVFIFSPSVASGLTSELTFHLLLKLENKEEEVITLRLAAYSADLHAVSNVPPKELIYEGAFQEGVLKQLITEKLYHVLSEALEFMEGSEIKTGVIHMLSLKGKDAR